MAFPKKKKTGIPVMDKPSPIQKSIEQPQSKQQPQQPKTAGNKSINFHDDGTVTVVDEYGLARQYRDRDSYMEGEKTNTRFQYAPNERQALVEKGLAKPTDQEAAQIEQQTQQKTQELASKLPQGKVMSPNVESPNILPEVLGNVGQGAAKGAALGATAGVVGAPVTEGVSIPVLAAGGAAVGGISAAFGVIPALKSEYGQISGAEVKTATGANRILNSIITDANNKITSPEVLQQRWAYEWQRIDQAKANTLKLSEKDWLTKAKPNLVAFENLEMARSTYNNRFAMALIKPDPGQNVPMEYLETE